MDNITSIQLFYLRVMLVRIALFHSKKESVSFGVATTLDPGPWTNEQHVMSLVLGGKHKESTEPEETIASTTPLRSCDKR